MQVYHRGNVELPGELAPPGFLRVLEVKGTAQAKREKFSRMDLADAICAPENPLTARVIVNRIWQQHFGRGIVATASNFGKLGERPTHPELLDTLAVRFIESGWSLKWLHRQIVHSAAYQLSSHADENAASVDPDNRWVWRFTPRRLDVEAWRDAVLAVSGRLDRAMGGPAAGRAEEGHVRRTIYSTISRRDPDKMLVTFGFPDANVTSEARDVTTVPQQQLFALNSDFMLQSARGLAARSLAISSDQRRRIDVVYGWAYARPPSAQEYEFTREFLDLTTTPSDADQLTNWEQFCQAVLAANEFSWID
jgi:hypothetical protein